MYKLYVLICLLLASVCFGSEINVPGDYSTIQAAIDAAGSGDTVSVAAGRYVENITIMEGIAVIGAGSDVCTIDGGAAGSVVVCSDCSSETRLVGFTITNGTVKNGGGMYNSNSTVAVADCVFESNTGTYGGIVLNDSSTITFTGCTFSGNTATTGGMLNRNASDVTLLNCTFTENTSENNGGAMRNTSSSTVTITGCSFTDNTATNTNAGGIYCESGTTVTVTDCTLSRNFPQHITGDYTDGGGNSVDYCVDSDTDNSAHYRIIQAAIDAAEDGDIVTVMPGTYVENLDMSGKAITLQSSDPTDAEVITTTILDGNASGSVIKCISVEGADTVITGFVITNGTGTVGDRDCTYGGGIFNRYGSSPTISNCTFSGNISDYGGGIFNRNSSLTLTNCTFSGNISDYGGGMCNFESSPTVSNCTFWDNTATEGGGMCNLDCSSVKVSNCTFSGNTATGGGGMYNLDCSSVKVSNCTFSGNTADGTGGGVYNTSGSSLQMTDNSFCLNSPNGISGNYTDNGGNGFGFCVSPAISTMTITGDLDGDGDVDLIDFAAFAENWLMVSE